MGAQVKVVECQALSCVASNRPSSAACSGVRLASPRRIGPLANESAVMLSWPPWIRA